MMVNDSDELRRLVADGFDGALRRVVDAAVSHHIGWGVNDEIKDAIRSEAQKIVSGDDEVRGRIREALIYWIRAHGPKDRDDRDASSFDGHAPNKKYWPPYDELYKLVKLFVAIDDVAKKGGVDPFDDPDGLLAGVFKMDAFRGDLSSKIEAAINRARVILSGPPVSP